MSDRTKRFVKAAFELGYSSDKPCMAAGDPDFLKLNDEYAKIPKEEHEMPFELVRAYADGKMQRVIDESESILE